jgi:hypothetical protein
MLESVIRTTLKFSTGDVDIKLITSKMKKIGFKPIRSKQYKMMHSVDLVYDQVYTFSLE